MGKQTPKVLAVKTGVHKVGSQERSVYKLEQAPDGASQPARPGRPMGGRQR